MSCPKGTKLNNGEDTCGSLDNTKFSFEPRKKLVEDSNTMTTKTSDINECADYCYQNKCNIFSVEREMSEEEDMAGASLKKREKEFKCIISTNANQQTSEVDINGKTTGTTFKRNNPLQ